MKTQKLLTLPARAVVLMVLGFNTAGGMACGQQFEPARSHSDDTALICEAGSLLGSGGPGDAAAQQRVLVAPPQEQQMLITIITRVDVDRNQQLDHHELQTLDYLTRQQLLHDADSNRDRQLSFSELQQALRPPPSEPAESTTPDLQRSERPSLAAFRNLSRFGVGIPSSAQPTRNRSVSRAATFGNMAGYYSVQSPTQTRPQMVGFDVYRRSSGQYTVMPSCR